MPILTLMCEVCGEDLGFFNTQTLGSPMTGAMFTSLDPERDFPRPFPVELEWIDLKCPYCRTRPFIETRKVMTPLGYFEIGTATVPGKGGYQTALPENTKDEFVRRAIRLRMEAGLSFRKIGMEIGMSGEWVRKNLKGKVPDRRTKKDGD